MSKRAITQQRNNATVPELARLVDGYAAESAFYATWDPESWDDAVADRLASVAALVVLVLAAHGRDHAGPARWCETEACRAAEAIEQGAGYP